MKYSFACFLNEPSFYDAKRMEYGLYAKKSIWPINMLALTQNAQKIFILRRLNVSWIPCALTQCKDNSPTTFETENFSR
jgi:hypothetical protein